MDKRHTDSPPKSKWLARVTLSIHYRTPRFTSGRSHHPNQKRAARTGRNEQTDRRIRAVIHGIENQQANPTLATAEVIKAVWVAYGRISIAPANLDLRGMGIQTLWCCSGTNAQIEEWVIFCERACTRSFLARWEKLRLQATSHSRSTPLENGSPVPRGLYYREWKFL